MTSTRVLVIGAGAVGLVYGAHLAEGGASVALFVRERRRQEAQAGYALTRVSMRRPRATRTFVPESVVASEAEVRSFDPDQVWVATATDALTEPWLAGLVAACPRAIVVFLQPGGDALDRMRALVPDERRRVRGAIAMASWHAPLEGSADAREVATPPGYAYLLPPLGASGFEGPRSGEVIAALRRGGCPASRAEVTVSLARGSAVLLPHVAALEVAGWSLSRLGTRPIAALAAEASREALAIACARIEVRTPLARIALRAWVTRLGARLAARVAPFDLEAYLRVHFLKVRAQTLLLLGEYVRDAEVRGLPSRALRALRERLSP